MNIESRTAEEWVEYLEQACSVINGLIDKVEYPDGSYETFMKIRKPALDAIVKLSEIQQYINESL